MRSATPLLDPVLDQLVRCIVEHVHPERVILFGSRARGDARTDSDYDLIVEVDAAREPREVQTALSPCLYGESRIAGVDVLVRHAGELEARADDPGYLEWDVARDGVVLYPAPVRHVRERHGRRED